MSEKNNLKNVISENKKPGKLNLDIIINNKNLLNKEENITNKKNNSKSKFEEKNSLTTEECISSSLLDVETMTYLKPTPKNNENIIINNKISLNYKIIKDNNNKKNLNNNKIRVNTNNKEKEKIYYKNQNKGVNKYLNKNMVMKARNYQKLPLSLTNNTSKNEVVNNTFKSKKIRTKSSNESKNKKRYSKNEKKENNLNKNNIKNCELKKNDKKIYKFKKQLTINLNSINSFINNKKSIVNNTTSNRNNKKNKILKSKQKLDLTNNKIFKDSVLLKEGEKYRIINLNNINKGKTKGRLDLTRIPSKEKIERIRLNKPKTNYIIKKNFNDNNNIILLEENEISDNENELKEHKKSNKNKILVNNNIKKSNIPEKKIDTGIKCSHSYYPNKLKNVLSIDDYEFINHIKTNSYTKNYINNKKKVNNVNKNERNIIITGNKNIKEKYLYNNYLSINKNNISGKENKNKKNTLNELKIERISRENIFQKKFVESYNTSQNKEKNKRINISRSNTNQKNEIKLIKKYKNKDNFKILSTNVKNKNMNENNNCKYQKIDKIEKISLEQDNKLELNELNYGKKSKLNENLKEFILNHKKLYSNLYYFNSDKIKNKDNNKSGKKIKKNKINDFYSENGCFLDFSRINKSRNITSRNSIMNNSQSLRNTENNNYIFHTKPCYSAERGGKNHTTNRKIHKNRNILSIELNNNINNKLNINFFKKIN